MTIVAPHPLRCLLEVLVNGSTFFILYDILVTFVRYQILQENKILLLNDVISTSCRGNETSLRA